MIYGTNGSARSASSSSSSAAPLETSASSERSMKSKVQTSFRQNASSIGRWGRSATNPVTIPGSTASGTADVGYAYTLTGSPSPPHSPPINMPPPIPPRPVIRQSSFTKIGYMINTAVNGTKKQFSSSNSSSGNGGNGETSWCFSQIKGALDDDVTEADIISCVEFNDDGELLATGDKGGRVVIFQRDAASKASTPRRGEYNVYSTFQSHEPEFDYLKSLEIEEKINKIRWLKRKNQSHFLLSTNDKTIKLWKVSERDKRVEGYNTREDNGGVRDPTSITALRVPSIKPMDLMVEASPRRIFANAHTYHINSISVNSDQETYLSADDLRINLWHLEITDQSFNIVDIKPANMEELTEVITAAEFHPTECNVFVYSSSKGTIRLCDMRSSALCDRHAKLFEEPEDVDLTNKSFFREIISSISDVKLSNSGRYMISRDYLSIKVWDLHMETKPIETYPVHEYLRTKLCSLYENDCIFDKFECCWNGNDTAIMTGSYNNFFRIFDRSTNKDVTLEASRDIIKPKTVLKPRKVCTGGKRKKDEISVDCLAFNKRILHTAWHPLENIIAVAATNNLFIFQDKF
ncbi:serine/threonine-protein phosphatase 2A 55 kDa regulatory subunit B alpha isoform isoform X1 [Anopheles albimanus]|uniref:serine/threonine-protein phosphatase 2A 55 kDa regulatory subunit B alpha isoform isoform X1 n=1 Tax=Anopheles albimanus TaxID=7167 RepID=UPI001641ED05|nr:serine/threonine-protein phosphatase 2A 55 kDa regulatory subunit B alpha isoform isoform X1 [Anopheles albimanus]XP_035782680.1 serine/threonine-protein phosphatase 2A 55 kDa regulatory subunit B alpha isoform isoform X1 [Anopheles albimanus]XP_035782681.1 serine/threonine-protein phosphatase 2A 55 kDa regulatory subunit B alpha isoform isoform X1 [Anopheles albimanus]